METLKLDSLLMKGTTLGYISLYQTIDITTKYCTYEISY